MRVLCLLGCVIAMISPVAHAVEVEDYDVSPFSQEVAECDRLAEVSKRYPTAVGVTDV